MGLFQPSSYHEHQRVLEIILLSTTAPSAMKGYVLEHVTSVP